jgi:hypothetical protein
MTLKNLGANQSSVEVDGVEVFFSYKTPVAGFIPGRGYVRTDRKYSVTTTKHINKYVGANCTTVPQEMIDGLLKGVS